MNTLSENKFQPGSQLIFLTAMLLIMIIPNSVKGQTWVEKPLECCPTIDDYVQYNYYDYSISLGGKDCKMTWEVENGYIEDSYGKWVNKILNCSFTTVKVKWQNVSYDNNNKEMPKGN
ncbi:MAG: hypothetical protein GYA22_03775, partial [Bacteroidales bacterium]|nr:hypothetical protein [Bacteroidales bacterium]